MDRWLKIMEAFTAEQERIAQSRSEDQITADDELANLRSALTDREQALLAALRHGKELESALIRQRDAAESDTPTTCARSQTGRALRRRPRTGLRRTADRNADAGRGQAADRRTARRQGQTKRGQTGHRAQPQPSCGPPNRRSSDARRFGENAGRGGSNAHESKRYGTEIAQTRVQAETARKDYENHLAELNRKLTQVEGGWERIRSRLSQTNTREKRAAAMQNCRTESQHLGATEVAPKPDTLWGRLRSTCSGSRRTGRKGLRLSGYRPCGREARMAGRSPRR